MKVKYLYSSFLIGLEKKDFTEKMAVNLYLRLC